MNHERNKKYSKKVRLLAPAGQLHEYDTNGF